MQPDLSPSRADWNEASLIALELSGFASASFTFLREPPPIPLRRFLRLPYS